MKALLDQKFDAIFVGSGAPKGKNLEIPGRYDSDKIFIGIDWLAGVAFGHITQIEERVLIIGVGNTAMDAAGRRGASAAKTSRSWRAGRATTSRPRPGSWRTPKKSGVEIVVNHAPNRS